MLGYGAVLKLISKDLILDGTMMIKRREGIQNSEIDKLFTWKRRRYWRMIAEFTRLLSLGRMGGRTMGRPLSRSSTPGYRNEARHGARAPTKKRKRDLEALSIHLKVILQDAKQRGASLEKLSVLVMGMELSMEG
ncbi:hypothetical protein L2E82_36813 [Cichorium intybus]|uniref:Uncharacterized protein n=1 Tax=Cichorium intybus TaxID=13427 RepID=A0ACB9ACF0_CICIN|nr:hypothetical protein L2E82_36813 [Cichorium intybus]